MLVSGAGEECDKGQGTELRNEWERERDGGE